MDMATQTAPKQERLWITADVPKALVAFPPAGGV